MNGFVGQFRFLPTRSVLEALEDGDLPAVNEVVLRTGDALGIAGDWYDE